MILYHAVSIYQLLNCIVHRMTVNIDKECHIIIGDPLIRKITNKKCLKNDFFNDLYVYKFSSFSFSGDIGSNAQNVFNKFMSDENLDLKVYDDIIVGCAHSFFGIYLVEKDIEFTFMEDASGVYSRPEILENIESEISESKNEYCKKNGLYDASSKCIKKKMINTNTQVSNFKLDDTIEHFDLIEMLEKLNKDKIKKILNLFGVDKTYSVKEKNFIVFFTQHFANLRVLTLEEQKRIYSIVFDYFFDDTHIVLKPHPDDLLYYEEIFPEFQVIKEKFPSELLPFVFSEKPNNLGTITSTATFNFFKMYPNSITFSSEFERKFDKTHIYYFTLYLLNYFKNTHFNVNGVDKKLIENIIQYSDLEISHKMKYTEIDENNINDFDNVYIIDSFNSNHMSVENIKYLINKNVTVILLDRLNKATSEIISSKEFNAYIVPIVLKSEKIKFTFYVISKKKEIRSEIMSVNYDKTLKYSNDTISKEYMSDEQIKIKVLEGVLEATQKRLEYYIQREKELLDIINN